MSVRYKTHGFVFKKEDRGESDKVFSVFTQDFGRLEITGRAIRKITSKLRGGMELFFVSDIEFIQGKKIKTLTDAVPEKTFKQIKRVPEKLRCAYAMCQVVDMFIKGQEQDGQILALLIDAFEKLDACAEQAEQYLLVYHYFFWNFAAVLGYALNFSACATCEASLQATQLKISFQEGGLLCQSCSVSKKDATIISQDVVKLLRLVMEKKWGLLGKITIAPGLHKSLKSTADGYRDHLISKLT